MKSKGWDDRRTKRVDSLITYAVWYELEKYCKQRGVSVSTAVYELLQKGLENELMER